ncbi:MAG TPA: ribonuclease D [Candidatus Polarisedimenticolia bacterium]|nr:ribonuclease D [Candidatus Polarisedimenticolia bacterium]
MSDAPPHVWVETEDELARAAERLARAGSLAIDTEADSFYHYFHKCCLIQISDGETAYLVDPLALRRLDPLGEVLASTGSVKVLHAAEQDVLYLRRDCGFTLLPLFDTMIAAQLLGRPSIGLARLLEDHFGVTLDKGCQRDDWSRRPLSERQKQYAAEDVRHLIRLRELLQHELEEKGRLEWAQEEFDLVALRAWEPRAFDPEAFWTVKGVRDLPPRQAAVLRELYVMRDERAREGDVPPFRIVSDEALLALARLLPRSPAELQGIKGVTPLVRRRIGTQALAAVRRGLEVPESALPIPPRGRGRRKSSTSQARLERLRDWRKTLSADLGLDPGVLFPQSTLEALAVSGLAGLDHPEAIPGLRRWRRGLIAPEAGRLLA